MQVPLQIQPTININRVARSVKLITILTKLTALISLKLREPYALFKGRNYLFKLLKANLFKQENSFVTYIINLEI